ncbi:helix-turn-helix transcriptional regulator [Dehalobacter restrictus]|uniref:helix-turn-helix domain-containing protein n=1 Tax=Dehalobacter restrictus TaxID=55583 RepID=UPI0033901D97
MEIHKIVKRIRTSLGLSQVAFAKQMHVSFSTINRWENGHAQPNRLAIVMLIELCQRENICRDCLPELKKFSENR